VLSVVDTASDLIWTQCASCDPCFRQDLRHFDFTMSRMGYTVGCTDALCIAEPDVTMECTPRNGDKCGVRLGAVDFSGMLGVDVFGFGQDRANISLDCITGTQT
jgi:hypothetical protein